MPAEASAVPNGGRAWWSPGEARDLPQAIEYENAHGRLTLYNQGGPVETSGHPFFEPLGPNGRACVSCHQPADGMSLSITSIRERWEETAGRDPIFAAIDGSDCPSLPQGEAASHSLLLERGLFRVFLPWPPRDPWGAGRIEPEFKLEVVRDPAGCNLDPTYGLASDNPMVSVYRRPRMVANLPYVVHRNFGVGPFVGKTGEPALRDPENGQPVNMNLMADARQPTLGTQAMEASVTHLQLLNGLNPAQIAQITAFERQLFAAQTRDLHAGDLLAGPGGRAFGPRNLADGEIGVLGNNITRWVFPIDEAWGEPQARLTAEQNARRASIFRGQRIFHFRTFWIRDSMHLNTVGLGNPTKRTCATCHGMHMTGLDTANGWMDIGTTNLPWAREVPRNPWTTERERMPLFRITCRADLPPHPYYGREFYTQDPGRALISGKCNDVGTIVMQQFRGLAARPPYFSNGSAATLRELIDFYDRRYNIQYSEQEKVDLENFMATL
ncbi:MAG: hypothetical protein B7Z08_08360 [Sphingomonadales bacterium 32-68-7]|nr:MAG: hypothetical protein B7Z33_10150 [Sphingomonadales bacterium 12-68-11]OYX08730.1 MAG: hypothetical protein B7Z08_08360 [Sphingomonadales bacterium 32-68-7]